METRTDIVFGKYRIYENGELINILTGRKIKQTTKSPYKRYHISVYGKGLNINTHRLLAECFISNPENKEQVNHIDGNKHNNALSNLEWVTRKENALHSFKIGLQVASRPVKKVIDTSNGIIYESAKNAAKLLGFNHKTLCNMLNKKFTKQPNKTNLKYV